MFAKELLINLGTIVVSGFEDRQVLLGHTNRSVTTHYSGPGILNLIEAANKVCTERPEAVLRRVR